MADLTAPDYINYRSTSFHMNGSVAATGMYTCDVADVALNVYEVQTPIGLQTSPAVEEADAIAWVGGPPTRAVWVCKGGSVYALSELRQIHGSHWYAALIKCVLSGFEGQNAEFNGTHILWLAAADLASYWGQPHWEKYVYYPAWPYYTMYIRRRLGSSNRPFVFWWTFELWLPISGATYTRYITATNLPDPGVGDIEGTYTWAKPGTIEVSWPAGLV